MSVFGGLLYRLAQPPNPGAATSTRVADRIAHRAQHAHHAPSMLAAPAEVVAVASQGVVEDLGRSEKVVADEGAPDRDLNAAAAPARGGGAKTQRFTTKGVPIRK